jgi:hypothetical protein
MSDDLENAVAQFIARQIGVNLRSVRLDTTINRSLGVAGDDGEELMEAFAATFAVDLTGFDGNLYFGDEGGGNLLDIFSFLESQPPPLYVQDLVNAARNKRWLSDV